MSRLKPVLLTLFFILFIGSVLLYTLNWLGLVQAADYLPFLKPQNPLVVEDTAFPTEVEKTQYKKMMDQLLEKEEQINKQEQEILTKNENVTQKLAEIEELKKNLNSQKSKLTAMMKDWEDRQKKITDMSLKVRNMPPDKAQEMMQNWSDFDVIEVLRQMDKDSEIEGVPSITPYLLTLFEAKRRAAITRKMLLPPLSNDDSNTENIQTDDQISEEPVMGDDESDRVVDNSTINTDQQE